jgi:hypothetical protein
VRDLHGDAEQPEKKGNKHSAEPRELLIDPVEAEVRFRLESRISVRI